MVTSDTNQAIAEKRSSNQPQFKPDGVKSVEDREKLAIRNENVEVLRAIFESCNAEE